MKNNLNISIVIPTFNEKDTILLLIEELDTLLNNIKENYEIIIIDDDSPDGTGKILEEIKDTYPIKIIHRKNKKGLASAVLEGFKHCNGNIIGVIDGDFQHPPKTIPKILSELRESDIVIGSRYIEKGRIQNWKRSRKILSIGSIVLSHLVLPKIKDIKDTVSGFFFLKKKVIENKNINLDTIGFKLLLEILVKGKYNNVKEVGYTFKGRKKGKSNFSIKIIFDFIRQLFRLAKYEGELRRFLKFGIVGSLGLIINESLLWYFTDITHLYYLISSLFAIEAAIISNFIFHSIWTFKDRKIDRIFNLFKRFLKYNTTCTLGLSINITMLWILTDIFSIYYLFSNILAMGCAVLFNFTLCNHIVWNNES